MNVTKQLKDKHMIIKKQPKQPIRFATETQTHVKPLRIKGTLFIVNSNGLIGYNIRKSGTLDFTGGGFNTIKDLHKEALDESNLLVSNITQLLYTATITPYPGRSRKSKSRARTYGGLKNTYFVCKSEGVPLNTSEHGFKVPLKFTSIDKLILLILNAKKDVGYNKYNLQALLKLKRSRLRKDFNIL